jgi:hypothetical protein
MKVAKVFKCSCEMRGVVLYMVVNAELDVLCCVLHDRSPPCTRKLKVIMSLFI